MSLVETDWLEKNISNVKIIDCSWHMPQTKRDGFTEYEINHIPGSIFFDLDLSCQKFSSNIFLFITFNSSKIFFFSKKLLNS